MAEHNFNCLPTSSENKKLTRATKASHASCREGLFVAGLMPSCSKQINITNHIDKVRKEKHLVLEAIL